MNKKRLMSLLLSTILVITSCVSIGAITVKAAEEATGGSSDTAMLQEDAQAQGTGSEESSEELQEDVPQTQESNEAGTAEISEDDTDHNSEITGENQGNTGETDDAQISDTGDGEEESSEETDQAENTEELIDSEPGVSKKDAIETGEDKLGIENNENGSAVTGSCGDNAVWTLTGQDGNLTLTISGSGNMQDFDHDSGPQWESRNSEIRNIVIEDGITSVGSFAFRRCSNVTSIDIPDSVTTIGLYAFAGCGFTSVTIPSGVQRIGWAGFEACPNLATVVIPDSVTNLGDYSFAECKSLTSVTIPGGLTWIGDFPFDASRNISEVTITGDINDYVISNLRFMFGNTAWWKTLGDMIIIDNKLVSYEGKGQTAIIPDGVTSIENGAFADNTDVVSVDIPSSVTTIGPAAFSGCSSLSEIELPSGLTQIDDYTFHYCTSLEYVELPENLNSIGSFAFDDCVSLKEITIPDGVTEIQEFAFCDCSNLKRIQLSNTVRTIGDSAFLRCKNITSIEIPDGIESIGSNAFEDCTGLTFIDIPDGLDRIKIETFSGCTNLTGIVIPESVTEISSAAFGYDEEDLPENLVVYGAEGSYAESYCANHNIEFCNINGIPDIKILTQPEDVKATAGENVIFHVEVRGDAPSYQWQWSSDGTTWKNCTSGGYNTDTFSFKMKDTYAGRKYRCVVTFSRGKLITIPADLMLKTTGRITVQPADVTAAVGESVGLHVEYEGGSPTYQWQWSGNGTTWKNCTSAGFNTDTFSFAMKATLSGRQYRCVITDGTKTVTSNAAVIRLPEKVLEIIEQPSDIEATVGETVVFHVEADGNNPTYQWQWSSNGTTWKNCTSGGCKTDTFSFVMKATLSGRKYRCKVTDETQELMSRAATITLTDNSLRILTNPSDIQAAAGETVVFHVETNKSDVTYQWQWRTDGTAWKNCTSGGYNTDTFSFKMKASLSGRQYRCVVTCGTETLTSTAGLITLR